MLQGGVHQGDVHVAMRTVSLVPDGVRGEFDMAFAEIALRLQERSGGLLDCWIVGKSRSPQDDGGLALGAGDFLALVLDGEADVAAARGAGHLRGVLRVES